MWTPSKLEKLMGVVRASPTESAPPSGGPHYTPLDQ
jgi:hypothetical protein